MPSDINQGMGVRKSFNQTMIFSLVCLEVMEFFIRTLMGYDLDFTVPCNKDQSWTTNKFIYTIVFIRSEYREITN